MLRKIVLLLSGNVTASLLSLIRNLLVARLLTVENYGLAATFALVVALVEMTTAFGLQARIVQNRDGDNPKFQAGLQGFQAIRGLFSATILFFAAPYIAEFLNVPEMTWAYQTLALTPLFAGLEHFDVHRFQRDMRFGPLIAINVAPMAITLAMVWPLILWLEDWRVMLVIVIAQVALRTTASHVMAIRRYRIRFRLAEMRDSFEFGWPLMLNNILLFLIMQGDRGLVMRALGPEALAVFSLGVTLTMTPTLIMTKSLSSLLLPRLSAEQNPHRFQQRALQMMQGSILNGAILILVVFLLGEFFVLTFLGEKYIELVPLLGAFAALQAMRAVKGGPNIVALSRAHTSNAMMSNIPLLLTLPVIWVALQQGMGFKTVILIAFIGDVVGYALSLFLVWKHVESRLSNLVLPLIIVACLMAVSAGAVFLGDAVFGVPLWGIVCGLFVALIVSTSSIRRWVTYRSHL